MNRLNSPRAPVPKINEVIPKPTKKIEEIKPEAMPKPAATKMEINEEPTPKRFKKNNKRMRSPLKVFKSLTTPKTTPPKMSIEVKADMELIALDDSPAAGKTSR